MSISHRLSIRWLPDPASEPTATIVLTTPGGRFIDLRLTLSTPQSLYWGFSGMSLHTPTSGKWIHTVDSRSDTTVTDQGTLEVLENGDVLEKGAMVDFDDMQAGEKEYEEVWRDETGKGVVLVLEADGGCVVRIGGWCQGLLKVAGKMMVERWKEGERVFGGDAGEVLPCGVVWEKERELRMGEEVACAGRVWTVVERCVL